MRKRSPRSIIPTAILRGGGDDPHNPLKNWEVCMLESCIISQHDMTSIISDSNNFRTT